MKCYFVLFSLVCMALISSLECADRVVWIAGEESGVHPDHPGKCCSQSLNKEFRIGEEFTDKFKCELIRCGHMRRFSRRVCSVRSPQPGCTRIPPDPAKNYPDCCGMIQCAPVKIDY